MVVDETLVKRKAVVPDADGIVVAEDGTEIVKALPLRKKKKKKQPASWKKASSVDTSSSSFHLPAVDSSVGWGDEPDVTADESMIKESSEQVSEPSSAVKMEEEDVKISTETADDVAAAASAENVVDVEKKEEEEEEESEVVSALTGVSGPAVVDREEEILWETYKALSSSNSSSPPSCLSSEYASSHGEDKRVTHSARPSCEGTDEEEDAQVSSVEIPKKSVSTVSSKESKKSVRIESDKVDASEGKKKSKKSKKVTVSAPEPVAAPEPVVVETPAAVVEEKLDDVASDDEDDVNKNVRFNSAAWVVASDEASYSSDEDEHTCGHEATASASVPVEEMSWSVAPQDECSWSTELGMNADECSWSSTHNGDDESSWSVSHTGSKRSLGMNKAQALARQCMNKTTTLGSSTSSAKQDMMKKGSTSMGKSVRPALSEQVAKRRLKRKQHAAKKLAAMASAEAREAQAAGKGGSISRRNLRLVIVAAVTALLTIGTLYACGALSDRAPSKRAKSFPLSSANEEAASSSVYIVERSSMNSADPDCIRLPVESLRVAEHMQDLTYDEIVAFYDMDGDGSLSVQEMAAAVFPSETKPTPEVVNTATQLLFFVNARMNANRDGKANPAISLVPCPADESGVARSHTITADATFSSAATSSSSSSSSSSVSSSPSKIGLSDLRTTVPQTPKEEENWESVLKNGNAQLWDNMRQSFQFYDRNGDRRISAGELSVVLRLLDPNMSQAEMDKSFREADLNGNNVVEFSEFVRMVSDEELR